MPRTYRLAALALMTGACTSCGGTTRDAPEPDSNGDALTPERHCFRNEYRFPDDPNMADVLQLTLGIEGDSATGTYSWLPAFKDQRVGTLSGTHREGVIEATYQFTQEGSDDSTNVTITIEAGRATVRGGAPELGLASEIERVACTD